MELKLFFAGEFVPFPSFLFFPVWNFLQLTLTFIGKRGEDNVINNLLFSISFGGGGSVGTIYCDGKGKYLPCRLSLSLSFGRHFLFSVCWVLCFIKLKGNWPREKRKKASGTPFLLKERPGTLNVELGCKYLI